MTETAPSWRKQFGTDLGGKIKTLMARGERRGFLTYEEVDRHLPSDVLSPEKLAQILQLLEGAGFEIEERRDEPEPRESESVEPPPREQTVESPVRTYLTEIGRFPLLDREDELRLSVGIEIRRKCFTTKILESPVAVRKAIILLEGIRERKPRFARALRTRSLDVSGDRFIRRLPRLIRRLRTLLAQALRQYALAHKRGMSAVGRSRARAVVTRNRREWVHLLNGVGFQTHIAAVMVESLEETSSHMHRLAEERRNLKSGGAYEARRRELRDELAGLGLEALEDPEAFHRRLTEVLRLKMELDRAKQQFSNSNLRLVVALSKRFRNRGLAFLDLIQEGNTGLLRGVDKYEHRLGFKFSTYASWWIRQALSRAVADKSRTIRVPVHLLHRTTTLLREIRNLTQRKGRKPSLQEISIGSGLPLEEVKQLLTMSRQPNSLDMPLGDDEWSYGDLIEDRTAEAPLQFAGREALKDKVERILCTLPFREREIVRLRYGIGLDQPYTLAEVGHIFKITRERVRQLQVKAVARLMHTAQSHGLKHFPLSSSL